jgi:hypothetical protein
LIGQEAANVVFILPSPVIHDFAFEDIHITGNSLIAEGLEGNSVSMRLLCANPSLNCCSDSEWQNRWLGTRPLRHDYLPEQAFLCIHTSRIAFLEDHYLARRDKPHLRCFFVNHQRLEKWNAVKLVSHAQKLNTVCPAYYFASEVRVARV